MSCPDDGCSSPSYSEPVWSPRSPLSRAYSREDDSSKSLLSTFRNKTRLLPDLLCESPPWQARYIGEGLVQCFMGDKLVLVAAKNSEVWEKSELIHEYGLLDKKKPSHRVTSFRFLEMSSCSVAGFFDGSVKINVPIVRKDGDGDGRWHVDPSHFYIPGHVDKHPVVDAYINPLETCWVSVITYNVILCEYTITVYDLSQDDEKLYSIRTHEEYTGFAWFCDNSDLFLLVTSSAIRIFEISRGTDPVSTLWIHCELKGIAANPHFPTMFCGIAENTIFVFDRRMLFSPTHILSLKEECRGSGIPNMVRFNPTRGDELIVHMKGAANIARVFIASPGDLAFLSRAPFRYRDPKDFLDIIEWSQGYFEPLKNKPLRNKDIRDFIEKRTNFLKDQVTKPTPIIEYSELSAEAKELAESWARQCNLPQSSPPLEESEKFTYSKSSDTTASKMLSSVSLNDLVSCPVIEEEYPLSRRSSSCPSLNSEFVIIPSCHSPSWTRSTWYGPSRIKVNESRPPIKSKIPAHFRKAQEIAKGKSSDEKSQDPEYMSLRDHIEGCAQDMFLGAELDLKNMHIFTTEEDEISLDELPTEADVSNICLENTFKRDDNANDNPNTSDELEISGDSKDSDNYKLPTRERRPSIVFTDDVLSQQDKSEPILSEYEEHRARTDSVYRRIRILNTEHKLCFPNLKKLISFEFSPHSASLLGCGVDFNDRFGFQSIMGVNYPCTWGADKYSILSVKKVRFCSLYSMMGRDLYKKTVERAKRGVAEFSVEPRIDRIKDMKDRSMRTLLCESKGSERMFYCWFSDIFDANHFISPNAEKPIAEYIPEPTRKNFENKSQDSDNSKSESASNASPPKPVIPPGANSPVKVPERVPDVNDIMYPVRGLPGLLQMASIEPSLKDQGYFDGDLLGTPLLHVSEERENMLFMMGMPELEDRQGVREVVFKHYDHTLPNFKPYRCIYLAFVYVCPNVLQKMFDDLRIAYGKGADPGSIDYRNHGPITQFDIAYKLWKKFVILRTEKLVDENYKLFYREWFDEYDKYLEHTRKKCDPEMYSCLTFMKMILDDSDAETYRWKLANDFDTPLVSRAAFMSLHMPHDELNQALVYQMNLCNGLERLIYVGIGTHPDCLKTILSYADKTQDSQIAALILLTGQCFAMPVNDATQQANVKNGFEDLGLLAMEDKFPEMYLEHPDGYKGFYETRAHIIIERYLTLLTSAKLHKVRCKLHGLLHTPKHRLDAFWSISCTFCYEPVVGAWEKAEQIQLEKDAKKREEMKKKMLYEAKNPSRFRKPAPPPPKKKIDDDEEEDKVPRMMSCPMPLCRKPYPKCAICLRSYGCPVVGYDHHMGHENAHAFSYCMRCEHGGHGAHMARWFKHTTICPICDCRCTEYKDLNNVPPSLVAEQMQEALRFDIPDDLHDYIYSTDTRLCEQLRFAKHVPGRIKEEDRQRVFSMNQHGPRDDDAVVYAKAVAILEKEKREERQRQAEFERRNLERQQQRRLEEQTEMAKLEFEEQRKEMEERQKRQDECYVVEEQELTSESESSESEQAPSIETRNNEKAEPLEIIEEEYSDEHEGGSVESDEIENAVEAE